MTETSFAVAADGTPIAYELTGEGDPLVLVHSAAADARQWDRLVPVLSRSFKVVAMDRRGRRRSGPCRPGHSLEVEYGDVAAVVGSIPGPVHLLGHSSGARYALHAAARVSQLASLMLYEPPPAETFSDSVMESIDRLEAAGDRVGLLRLFLLEVAGNSEEAFRFIRGRPIWPLMVDNALTLAPELRAARHYRFDPGELARVQVPTLVLVGERSDPEARAAASEVAEALPKATVVALAGQGHGAMFSAPDLLATAVEDFVGGVTAPRGPG